MTAELDLAKEAIVAGKAREAALHAELQHRVRNILAVVRSIFSRTVDTTESVEHVGDHFRGRIDALALYQIGATLPAGYYLEDMVRDALIVYAVGDDPRVAIGGPEVRLEQRVAESIGLALHELVTNSIKFGALSTSDGPGRLTIEWRMEKNLLSFDWIETGISILSAAPRRVGFGREYLEQALPYQLGGSSRFDLTAGRLACNLSIPLKRDAILLEP
jgi:two-component sensor histidine kinase